MAIGRLSVKVGKKGKASKHAQYIFRQGKYAKADGLEDLEFVGHGNMPKWAEHNPNFFWQMADAHERKNGSTYREHEIALPRELTPQQRLELVQEWIEQELGDKHAYQFAIHNPTALDGGEQPHVHLMFSDRLIDDIERDPEQYFKRYNSKHPERGGAKKANTAKKSADRKAELKEMRERWEILHNEHMKKNGFDKTISMKSYKDRGIKYKPLHIPINKLKDKKRPKYGKAYKEQLQLKKDFFELRKERSQIDIDQELQRLSREKQQLTELEHTLAYKAMLYIGHDNDTLDNRFNVDDAVTYDERQIKEIERYRQDNKLYFLGSEHESPIFRQGVANRPERLKDFFKNADNLANKDTQKIIKLITEPEKERQEYEQQISEKSDLKSTVQNQHSEEQKRTISNRRFRP